MRFYIIDDNIVLESKLSKELSLEEVANQRPPFQYTHDSAHSSWFCVA